MYRIMIAAHLIGLAVCIYMLYILLSRKGRQINAFIIMAIMLNCFLLIGYSYELLATSVEEMLIAIQLGYIGKCFIGASFLTGIGRYYNWQYKKHTMPFVWGMSMIGAVVILTAKYHKFYYTSIELVWHNGHAFCKLGKAPFYYIFLGYILGLFIYFTYRCILYRRIVRAQTEKRVLGIVIAGSVAAIIGVTGSILFSDYYDFSPLIFGVYSMVFLYCMQKYSLFDTVDTAIYQVAAENSQAILVIGENDNLIYANKTAHRLFDWITDKETDSGTITESIRKNFLSGQSECRMGDRDYQITVSEVTDGLSVLGRTITLADITQMKRHTLELEMLSQKANEANRVKTSFLARMSHEIRTPINTILGMNEMILRESRSKEIIGYAENIKDSGRILLNIINDILDFSKIESGKMEIICNHYKTAEIIHDVVNMIEVEVEQKNLTFCLEAAEDIPSVMYGDSVRIQQVILNLLTNAVKYTHEGTVTFRIGGAYTGTDRYTLHVEVEDTGIGIKEEDIQNIFDFFHRIEAEKNRNIEGTGLGLNIAQHALQMMGSRIQIESRYGKGSKFYFDLEQTVVDRKPVGNLHRKIKESRLGGWSLGVSFVAPRARVLVVDDNRMNLEVFKGLLKDTQMQIDTADDGKTALERLCAESYDMVFMDHMMPEMDGLETYEKLKDMWKNCPEEVKTPETTPVIVLTANAIAGVREMYLEKGFRDYMSKPVDYASLEQMIVRYLPGQKVRHPEERTGTEGLSQLSGQIHPQNMDEKFKMLEEYGIDLEEGLHHMRGNLDTYEEILHIYFRELPDRLARLSCYRKQNDMKNYCVDVHSLKSTSKSVGALAIAQLAKLHEEESRRGNSAYIEEHFDELCLECEKLLQAGMRFKDMEK